MDLTTVLVFACFQLHPMVNCTGDKINGSAKPSKNLVEKGKSIFMSIVQGIVALAFDPVSIKLIYLT
jgi:hypothetical protein